ncbi:cysteine-rich CWC family protein [Aquimarina muelleri]|uniref:cysteine-rich CWC family protein n=1 Tax=Aquimarina muelleri TaxID=279356 RepID=UPI0009D7236C|nr:cysteine-rich CWC family protein [Aquimarina muelleri]MCX2764652.1 cysteine-rich CWC family protein [Aquimarina muelleri]
MIKHEEKYCPRCKSQFECKVGSILLCQCTIINLSNEERNYINEKYDDCLCANCMKALKSEYHNQLFQNKLKNILGVFYKKPNHKTK